jgi:hypothetical protein
MLLDFDPDVVGIAAQPFWLLWTTPEGKSCSHAPDFFARSAGGAALVMDCRPHGRTLSPCRNGVVVNSSDAPLAARITGSGSSSVSLPGQTTWISAYGRSVLSSSGNHRSRAGCRRC